jgi:hypothetical protein
MIRLGFFGFLAGGSLELGGAADEDADADGGGGGGAFNGAGHSRTKFIQNRKTFCENN